MFTIDSEGHISSLPQAEGERSYDVPDALKFSTSRQLSDLIMAHPGEFAVQLWNHLPGVTPINTPKFRNRSTAIERIWGKLCELYPDAVPSEEMPKAKVKRNPTSARERLRKSAKAHIKAAQAKDRHASAWATELTEALRKLFNPGEEFALKDIYRLIPAFKRRHPENKHVAARLRATVAQDLRGKGIVKSLKRGKYRMLTA